MSGSYGHSPEQEPDDEVQRGPPMTFSKAIDRIGTGPFQSRLVIICGMGWMIDAIEVLVVAFVVENVAISFDLNSMQKGLISSASFLGMLVGAGFWSIYADKRGRRTAFVQSLASIFVGGVFSAVAPSFGVLCVCRVVVGFGVGGNLPVTSALVTEFLPTNDRADVVCRIAGIFWGIGSVAASLLGFALANIFGPGEEEDMWRWFLGLAAIPSAIVAVAYRLLPESPRFLQVMGRHEEAMQVLEHVARMNGKLAVLGFDFAGQANGNGDGDTTRLREVQPFSFEPAGDLADDGVAPSNGTGGKEAETVEAGDVRELFHTPILRRVTLCIWVVWLTLNMSYFGMGILLPRYFADVSGGQENFVYILSALIGATNIPGAFAGTWLCSEHRLGRVGTITWMSHAAAVMFLVVAATLRVTALFSITSLIALFVLSIPQAVKYVLTPELYATKYRAVGLGSASVVTRVGGLLAPILAEVLYDSWGPPGPLFVFGPILTIAGIAAGMIPVETAGKQLDDDSWDRK